MRNKQKMMTEKERVTEVNIKVTMHKNEKKGETTSEIEKENCQKVEKRRKQIYKRRKRRLMKREQERVEKIKSIERVRKERKEKCHFIVLYLLVLNISVDLWVAITYN